jgi:predicted metal-dependent peptidase
MPWERVLRRLLARALVEAALPDWRRPSRRWLAADADARAHARPAPAFEPGRARPAARMRLAVAVDTSGSVGAPLLARFAAEIAGIGRRTGAEVHVLGFDTAVTLRAVMQGADWARQIRALAFTRGGGTDFAPALRAAADLSPSAIVVLSDLIGPTGPPPGRIPVIWAVPRRPAAPPPFGRVLLLDG